MLQVITKHFSKNTQLPSLLDYSDERFKQNEILSHRFFRNSLSEFSGQVQLTVEGSSNRGTNFRLGNIKVPRIVELKRGY